MRRLILYRHAKTEARAAGQNDMDRALTPRGRGDAIAMGRLAAEHGLEPDLVLVSPSVRTRETWDLAAPSFPAAQCRFRDGLYDATAEEIMAEVETAATPDTLMVVGHNPGLHELAVSLLVDGAASPADVERVSARFPTATIAAFALDGEGRASLEGLFYPRDTRGDG